MNHDSTVPEIPKAESREMMVSNAKDTSKRIKVQMEPESMTRKRSLTALRSAVSVLWRVQKPHWEHS